MHTNFFQACTDSVWQTPSGVKLTADSTSLYWVVAYSLRLSDARTLRFFFFAFYLHFSLLLFLSGLLRSVWQLFSKGKTQTSNKTSALSSLSVCAEEFSRTSEQHSYKYRKHLKVFQGSATGYTALNNILHSDTDFHNRFPILLVNQHVTLGSKKCEEGTRGGPHCDRRAQVPVSKEAAPSGAVLWFP